MLSYFFIDRPIFASVLSIVITLTGTIAGLALPIAQYPEIAPPTVQVSVNYPGASARSSPTRWRRPSSSRSTASRGMLYMSSQSGNDGSYNLTVTFDLGTDLNTALVMVQNRCRPGHAAAAAGGAAAGHHHQEEDARTSSWSSTSISPDGRYDDLYLSNYATINIKDEMLPPGRRRRHQLPRRARLQHPRLARPAETGGAQHGGQRGRRTPSAEPERRPLAAA